MKWRKFVTRITNIYFRSHWILPFDSVLRQSNQDCIHALFAYILILSHLISQGISYLHLLTCACYMSAATVLTQNVLFCGQLQDATVCAVAYMARRIVRAHAVECLFVCLFVCLLARVVLCKRAGCLWCKLPGRRLQKSSFCRRCLNWVRSEHSAIFAKLEKGLVNT